MLTITILGSTVGCCINCERRRNPPPPPPPVTPQTIGVSEGCHDRTLLDNIAATAVREALKIFREHMWTTDFEKGNILPEYLFPDKCINAIAQQSTKIKTTQNIANIEPKWPLVRRYGDSALDTIRTSVNGVEQRWAAQQQVLAERRLAVEAEKAEKKKKEQEEREAKAQEKKRLSDEKKKEAAEAKKRQQLLDRERKASEREKKKSEEAEAKWNAYQSDLKRGVKRKGPPPKKPGT